MARNKIDFGIDLGTTNSAISFMEAGEPTIIKSDVQKDTVPSCVSINKKGSFLAGDPAIHAFRSEREKALNKSIDFNSFNEFKRTMGTDKKYFSSHLDKDFSSEELSAEILKKLKSLVKNEKIDSSIITIPAAFKQNQVDATRRAAGLAGFNYVELLQEPIAASMAYGLNSNNKDGFWVVFDFGGGTFDSALVKVEDGIMKIIDTEGNNYLGGKNLDYAIVDEIIIPHIQEKFNIDGILQDGEKRNKYRTALKFRAEELKNQLSFKDEVNLYVDPGDAGEDDDGEEIEIDITLKRDQLKEILAPVYQKAIDSTKKLLQRNNIKGNDLDEIILVGGPTLSPIVQEMLSQQIKQPDISMDPMTVVSKGAALYASTVDLPDDIKEKTRDRSKIQLDLSYESTSVEKEEYVTIKTLADKIEGNVPEKIYLELKRQDGAWKSNKTEINEIGDVVEVSLKEDVNNIFEIILIDEQGNALECEPDHISIIQGSKVESATLPYNIGIEVKDKTTGKVNFKTVKGLEKNKSLKNAIGQLTGLKNQKQLRPGNKSDYIKIPIYQGEHGADGTRAIYNEHVYDVIISGEDIPSLLPENTDIDVTIVEDRSQNMTVKAYFTYLDYTAEVEVPNDNTQSTDAYWLDNEIKKAKSALIDLKANSNADESKINRLEEKINELEKQFNQNKEDVDTKQEVLSNLRTSLKEIDKEKEGQEWPQLEKQLKESFYKLEKINEEKGNEQTTQLVNKYRDDVEKVIQDQDKKVAPQLIEDINSLAFELERLENLIGFVLFLEQDFDKIPWKDANSARTSINQAKGIISNQPTIQQLQPIVNDLFYNAGFDKQKPSGTGVDDSILIG